MSAHAESARLIEVYLPNGGDLVTIAEAYFDESYEDDGPRVLCVAGYVFRKSKALEFGKTWSAYLRAKGLPYFHANECAHACGVFEGRDDTDQIARRLIALTKEKADFGVAVAVDRNAFAEVFTDTKIVWPSPYAFALTNCLYSMAHWRMEMHRTSPTAFFFEQGHEHADDAHRYLRFLLKSDDFAPRLGYHSHGFVPKVTPQVQPADLLAWLWRLQYSRVLSKSTRPWRADLTAMKRPRDRLTYFGKAELEYFKSNIRAEQDGADAILRDVGRQMGLPEWALKDIEEYRPDYRTTTL